MEEQLTALQKLINTIIEFGVNYSFQVLGAIIVLIIGALIAKGIGELVFKLLQKKKMDIPLSKFIAGAVRVSILSFALIIALGKFGITIAPFIAALSAVAFGSTLAFQGPLSNYGAGLSIILSRSFTVGDTITVADVSGVVQDVKLAATVLLTEDGVKITIPNKHIVGEIVYNSGANRVVEAVVGIGYGSDPQKAIQVIKQALSQFKEVVPEPTPQIGIQSFGDSAINIAYRYWAPTVKYFSTLHAVNFAVYKALEAANIPIPFPQRDIHIVSQPAHT